METLKLTKDVFVKNQYERVIDTKFTQLVSPAPSLIVSQSLPSINEFFGYYTQLFYQIPETGQINSHEYLIKQSSEYIGFEQSKEEVNALLDEIQTLRTENLDLSRQLLNIQISSSNAASI
jgi:hypothetical protein